MMINGYYNSKLRDIEVLDDKIIVDNHVIKYSDIYDIHYKNCLRYSTIYTSSIFVISFIIIFVIFLFVSNTYIYLLAFALLMLSLTYIYKIFYKNLIDKSKSEYLLFLDIITKDTHYTFLIKEEDKVDKKSFNLPKKTYWQNRFLAKYIKRIDKSRKYLYTQYEIGQWRNISELTHKYHTVSAAKYRFLNNQLLDLKTITVTTSVYEKLLRKYIDIGFILSRLELVFIVLLAITWLFK